MNLLGLSLALIAQVPAPGEGVLARNAALSAEREAIGAEESVALDALADRVAKSGRTEEAVKLRAWIEPPVAREGPIRVVLLPEVVKKAAVDASKPDPWRVEGESIRRKAASSLVSLARKALAPGTSRLAFADGCLRAAIARDPDHPEARRLLGYKPFEGGWATPGAIARRKEKYSLDPTYGWVSDSWPPKLAQGLLPGRNPAAPWLPAAQANALRSDIARGWQIKSAPHFRIQADVPLAEAIAFGGRLEALQDVFLALFADVLGPRSAPIAQRFAEKPGALSPDRLGPFEVFYFAGKAEYIEYLAQAERRDEAMSLGLYLPPGLVRAKPKKEAGRSYFFRDLGGKLDVTATLYHEGSHQILFESVASSSGYTKNQGNYWVWEGLGTYFETLTPVDGGAVEIGGLVGPRFATARAWLIDAGKFVPTAKFTALGQDEFKQGDKEAITAYYVESMALTLYLMNAEGGQYRDAFIAYVADGTGGRLKSSKELENRLGIPSNVLDRDFLAWLDRNTRKP